MSSESDMPIDVIKTKDVSIDSPYALVGLPDAGLVGVIAGNYVAEQMEMEEFGYIDSDRFPALIVVKNKEVKNAVRLYRKDNYMLVLSDIPISPTIATPFAKSLVNWLKGFSPKAVINITGVPVQNRAQIEKPKVLGLATGSASDLMKSSDLIELNDGALFGAYAAVIKQCVQHDIPSLTLLAQAHLNFPDPTASIQALDVINKMLDTNIDLQPLEEEAETIRIRTRKLMKQTEGAMKGAKEEAPPKIYG